MKIQIFIFGLFVGVTLAQDDIEKDTVKLVNFGRQHYRHRRDIDATADSYGAHEREESSTVRNNRGHRHHHFQHSAEWHRMHEMPLPEEDEHGERLHSFTHNPEWHRRHGLPMPVGTNRHHFPHRHRNFSTYTTASSSTNRDITTPKTTSRTTTTQRPATTKSTSIRPRTATTKRTTSTTKATRRVETTPDPEYSREIYDTKRQVEYDDIETFMNRVDP